MSGIPIYQFCRAFDKVHYSKKHDRYVSGGNVFGKIALWNAPVPEPIRQAVIDGYFRLNDNYPPDQDDFALIAREIDDKYSVLAVANGELDDGDRPTIGYKYFWLEKSSPDIDGIGTLTYWWYTHEQPKPKFDMSELFQQSSPKIFYFDKEQFGKPTFKEPELQEISEIVENQEKIPYIVDVVVFREKIGQQQQQYPESMKRHYLALGLSVRANYLNAWAWNVQKIEYPEAFLAVFYATQKDIPSNIRNRDLPPLPETHNPNNQTSVAIQLENTTHPSTETLNLIPPAKEKSIKSCLSSLANAFNQNRLDDRKIQELFGYLRDYADADWTNCIDKTTLKNASSPHEIYPQLIYLVAPNNPSSKKWLLQMVESLEIDTKKTYPRILEFQRVLLEASFEYKDSLVNERLISSIYAGISYLLNQLMSTEKGNNKIEFLLTKSQNVWSHYFLTYAGLIEKRIFSEEKTIIEESMEDFCQEILTLLQRPQNISLAERKQYKKLASTFIKINYFSLAGAFHYISDKYIPPIIQDKIHYEILIKIYNIKSHKTDSPPKNNNEPQANKSKDDESKETDPQNDESRSNKPKDNPIPDNPNNPIQNEYNRQAFILFVLFLAGSILLKLWKRFFLPPKILLLFFSIIYAILSVIVIHLTIDNFFNRRNHHFKHTNRIIGISLAIFYILVFVSIIWKIDKIPTSNNQLQLARQDTTKEEKQNNIPGENSHASPSNNINCPDDALTTFKAFKDCSKNESDKSQLEGELTNKYVLYVLSSPDNKIAGNLIKYYLNSGNEQEFEKRKDKIFNCQNSYSNPDQGDDNKKGDCIKDIIEKS
ncbi:hypothetical protein [Dolichospermum compactum]|uniref:Uncharacterized protein n=1 Tax=Dolichospermum compactum NIES-806 TaxID=1973481 RepID=A0A1Z4UXK9_9CYAN|nr:hypothetical protein [Dolichospermum compactum]BAZ83849.1 hypothetical protein NIES806_00290 [Dolichospermum compactum NIES-806]